MLRRFLQKYLGWPCDHIWKKESETETFVVPRFQPTVWTVGLAKKKELPAYLTVTYRCTKCCKFKSRRI